MKNCNEFDSINVTEQHIKDGCPGDSMECPIALAIYDLYRVNRFDLTMDVEVDEKRVTICYNDEQGQEHFNLFELPPEATAFIELVDSEPDEQLPQPQPFSFKVSELAGV